ncbi:MAG: [protein-PII] uridylyltransferase [Burkholderiaceae bacterium]
MSTVIAPSWLDNLKASYQVQRNEAIERFREDRKPVRLTVDLCAATDAVVRKLWSQAGMPQACCLLAVGGYGRGELFPSSDIDLLILLSAEPDEKTSKAVELFVSLGWDSGLAIGHSVRTLNDCREQEAADVTVQTALLERRWLAGDRSLFNQLSDVLVDGLGTYPFFKAKLQELRQRHRKYEDTPYSLEPNTKESPGGLRDLQTIQWVARRAGLGPSWQQMQKTGLITEAEQQLLEHNERFLRRIRVALHICAERAEDRLVFDLQGNVAAFLGYSDRPQRRASEQLMQRYYRAAKTIVQLTSIISQNIDELLGDTSKSPAQPLDDEFQSRNGLLEPIDPKIFENEPAAILRAFRNLQIHTSLRGMSTPTLRAMWNARTKIDARFRRERSNRLLFMEIIKSPQGVTHALRWMNQWSILGHYLPVFRRIIGRMQHDLFHVYTVDQHIMMVLRNLRRFALVEHAHEYPLCSQLLASMDDPWRLYVAALFHDIAKGRGGDHSELGAVDARAFCENHFVDPDDTNLICFLVTHHLTMSTVAQKQDISDPEVIERFAQIVQTEEGLTALYLLTVADIRGTSPKVWNNWKGKLLEDLYRATLQALRGRTPQPGQRMGVRRREAIRLLDLGAISPADYKDFWDGLEISYFLRTDADEIAWHTRVFSRHRDPQAPLVRTRISPFGIGFQVAIFQPDQHDLFARICAYFDKAGLSILDAKIHTTGAGHALDTFLIVDPFADSQDSRQYRDRLPLIEKQLTAHLADQSSLPEPSSGRVSRRSRSFPVKPSVNLKADESQQRYLLSIVANDRTGLLYRIARVLAEHQIDVQTARISTLGERAEDSFLVAGTALNNPREQLQVENELLQAIEAGD